MTISSSLNAGVAGLNANATRLASIADNIANSATYGYKRAAVDFHSMVLDAGNPRSYAAGGVRVSTARLIDERGPLAATANATDLALDGRGFLPVTNIEALGREGDYPLALVTTGSFRPDANGILRSDSGAVLLGWPAQPDGSMPVNQRDSAAGLQPVRVNQNQYAGDPTTRISVAVNLPATATQAGESGHAQDLSVDYVGNLGTSETLRFSFLPDVPEAGTSNAWTMQITDSASGAVVGAYRLQFDGSQALGGRLSSVTTLSGGAYDPATGGIPLDLGGGPVTLNIGLPGQAGGMTQLASTFAPVSIQKNGSLSASMVGVEVDPNGFLHAIYDEGFTRRIWQIPVVDVPNPNGLMSVANQMYHVSPASGQMFLWDAGDGPTGAMVGFSREESATDVARELTHLIQTQRAYSSNAKVIQTVDEMLQETTNIKR